VIFGREPALIYGLINAGIALLAAFGLNLTAEQTGALLAVTSAVLAIAVRQQVYSPDTVKKMTAGRGGVDTA
jgi:hypothetical protein